MFDQSVPLKRKPSKRNITNLKQPKIVIVKIGVGCHSCMGEIKKGEAYIKIQYHDAGASANICIDCMEHWLIELEMIKENTK